MGSKKLGVAIASLLIGIIAYVLICFLVFEQNRIFWVELLFTLIAFALCALAVRASFGRKLFINLPLYTIACVYLIVQIVICTVSLALRSDGELWFYVASILALALYLCIFITTRATAKHISGVDDVITNDTTFAKNLLLQLSMLAAELGGARKNKIDHLIDAVKYSELRSCSNSLEIESSINQNMDRIKIVLREKNPEAFDALCNELEIQISQRGQICCRKEGERNKQ